MPTAFVVRERVPSFRFDFFRAVTGTVPVRGQSLKNAWTHSEPSQGQSPFGDSPYGEAQRRAVEQAGGPLLPHAPACELVGTVQQHRARRPVAVGGDERR